MRIKSGIKLRKLGKRYMIVLSRNGVSDMSDVYTLNDTAAFIWNKAVGLESFTEEDAIAWILDEYVVDEAQARKDVHELLSQWAEYSFID